MKPEEWFLHRNYQVVFQSVQTNQKQNKATLNLNFGECSLLKRSLHRSSEDCNPSNTAATFCPDKQPDKH